MSNNCLVCMLFEDATQNNLTIPGTWLSQEKAAKYTVVESTLRHIGSKQAQEAGAFPSLKDEFGNTGY